MFLMLIKLNKSPITTKIVSMGKNMQREPMRTRQEVVTGSHGDRQTLTYVPRWRDVWHLTR